MRDQLLEVIALQREYSSLNTPAMQRRGELIRRIIPQQLETVKDQLRHALGAHGDDLDFEGRDATGRKTLIPWVRYYSETRSPSAQRGWYCVYLFDAPGTGVYLELGHGSTTFEEGEFRPRPAEELAKLVSWGGETLKSVTAIEPSLAQPMKLQGQDLGDAYERSAVLAKWYSVDEMPSDEQLFNDAVRFAGSLKLIYDAEVLGLAPTAPPPEVLAVERAASGVTERRSSVQGFGLNAAERQAVEMHAMARAKAHLQKLGWRVRDVSASRPYDFECTQGDKKIIVEVKGTTSTGDEIVVTRNEVDTHRARHPNNALIVVHSVNLVRAPGPPKADGGELFMCLPWQLEESQLRPIAFRCAVQQKKVE